MSKLEKKLKNIIENKLDSMHIFINKKIKGLFKEKNKKEIVRLLPIIIENTNEYNCSWLSRSISLTKIEGFSEVFIENLDKFKYLKSNSLFPSVTIVLQNIDLRDEQKIKIIDKLAKSEHIFDCCDIERLIYLLKSDNSNIDKYLLEKYIKNENSSIAAIEFCLYDKKYNSIFFENFNSIIENINKMDILILKDMIRINEKELRDSEFDIDEVISKIKNKIEMDIDKKEYLTKLLENIYNIIHYDNKINTLSDTGRKKLETIIEVIVMLIEDVAKNEKIKISDINLLINGGYSYPLEIGNKIIKIGNRRETNTFPNNPYIISPLLRKEFNIKDDVSLFIEVTEKVDTKTYVDDEELYQLYKKLRDLNLLWLDVKRANVGRLLKDNIIHWREDLPINNERIGLEKSRGNTILKKGEIVILDNDFIFDDKEFVYGDNDNYLYSVMGYKEKIYEERYQNEKQKESENNLDILKSQQEFENVSYKIEENISDSPNKKR